MNSPRVTDADRQRGWAELEVELTDGACEWVRVHALAPADLLALAILSPAAALTKGLAKALRADAEFIARLGPAQQVAIASMMADLIYGEREAGAIIKQSVLAVLAKGKS